MVLPMGSAEAGRYPSPGRPSEEALTERSPLHPQMGTCQDRDRRVSGPPVP